MNELKSSMLKYTKIFQTLVAVIVADIICKLVIPVAMDKKIDLDNYIDNYDIIFAVIVVTAVSYYFEHKKLKRIIASLEACEDDNDYKDEHVSS